MPEVMSLDSAVQEVSTAAEKRQVEGHALYIVYIKSITCKIAWLTVLDAN